MSSSDSESQEDPDFEPKLQPKSTKVDDGKEVKDKKRDKDKEKKKERKEKKEKNEKRKKTFWMPKTRSQRCT